MQGAGDRDRDRDTDTETERGPTSQPESVTIWEILRPCSAFILTIQLGGHSEV